VKYNFNPSFSVQLSVERGWMPKQDNGYTHDYRHKDQCQLVDNALHGGLA
jgi:hypothetical protein